MNILLNILATVGLTASGSVAAVMQTEQSIIKSEEILNFNQDGELNVSYGEGQKLFYALPSAWNFSSLNINSLEEFKSEFEFLSPVDSEGNQNTPSFYIESKDWNTKINLDVLNKLSSDEIIDGLEIDTHDKFVENATWVSSSTHPNDKNSILKFGYVLSSYWSEESNGFMLQATYGFNGQISEGIEFNYGYSLGKSLKVYSY